MKFARLILCFSIIALIVQTSQASVSCQDFPNQINTLIAKTMPNADVGIAITDAKTGKVLYQHNGYQAFSPASNVKLLTASASLYELGPNYRYKTMLITNKRQFKNNTLYSNLYFDFSGDPTVTLKTIKNLIKSLKKDGVKKITGNIVLDGSHFSLPNYAPGISYDDISWNYAAPISAFMVNQNALYFQIRPSDTLGKIAKVYTTANGRRYAQLLPSTVKTVTYQKSMRRCSLLVNVSDHNVFQLGGCWPISGHARGLKLAIRNPFLFTKKIIVDDIKKQGINFTGKVIQGKTPDHLDMIAEYKSPKLRTLLVTMMKESNNIYAESLTKTLGAVKYGNGSFQRGVTAIESILHHKTGIDFNKSRLADGAGASRYDLVTPMQFTRLLYVIYQNSDLRDLFMSTLPDAGANGTLRERMTSFDIKNYVTAKTGTMAGVSSLSGYIKTEHDQTLIFSIIVNHIVGSVNRARNFQDQLLLILRRYQSA